MAARARRLLFVSALLASSAAAETVTLSAVESRGSGGCHIWPGGTEYRIGTTWVNLLVFDLSALGAPVTAATLRLDNPPEGFSSPQNSEIYDVYGVTSQRSDLGCTAEKDVGVWAMMRDLGGGARLGSVEVTPASPRTLDIPLDPRIVRVLDRTQGVFMLSGRLREVEVSNVEVLFGGATGPAQLVLETASGADFSPAATLHVDPEVGSDLGDGSAGAPFATLAAALDLAAPGDTVAAGPGSYPEVLSLKNGVRLQGAGPDHSWIDSTGSPVAIRCADDAVLDGFRIANGSEGDNNTGHPVAISCLNGASPLISNNRIENNVGRAIDLADSDAEVVGNEIRLSPLRRSTADGISVTGGAPRFEANRIEEGIDVDLHTIRFERNRLTHGLSLGSCSGVGPPSRVANNVFEDSDDINAGYLVIQNCPDTEFVVANNVFFGAGFWASSSSSSHVTFANNVVVGAATGVSVNSVSVELLHNNVYGNAPPGAQLRNYEGVPDPTGTNGNVSVEALFLDPYGGDFRLSARSPLVDAGANGPAAESTTDVDGNARILDGDGDGSVVVDIGVHELDPEEETPLLVAIDIEPKRDPSWIRIPRRDTERTTAAILSRDDLDAPAEVDPDSLALGSAGSLVRQRGRPRCKAKDVDRDRAKDLVCEFYTAAVVEGTTQHGACLMGATLEGQALKGCERLRVFSSEYEP